MFFSRALRSKGVDAIFREADLDGDGKLTSTELHLAACKAMGNVQLSKARISTLLRVWDADGDGEISLSEFRSMISKMRATDNPELHEAWSVVGDLQEYIEKLKVAAGYRREEHADAEAINRHVDKLHAGDDNEKAEAAFHIGMRPARRESLKSGGTRASMSRGEAIGPLVALLGSGTAAQREQAAGALWNLSANGNKVGVGQAPNAVAALIACLVSDMTPTLTHHAAAALSSLAAGNQANRELIAKEGGLPPLVALLSSGATDTRKVATRALNNLCVASDHNRAKIAKLGAIEVLVQQLGGVQTQSGMHADATHHEHEETIAALAALAANSNENKVLIAMAGAIPLLVACLTGEPDAGKGKVRGSIYAKEDGGATPAQKARAAGALKVLAANAEYRVTIAQAGAIPPLVEMVRGGTPSQKSNAAGALWNLALENGENGMEIAKAGAIAPLMQMVSKGTEEQWEEAVGALECLEYDSRVKKMLKEQGWSHEGW